MIKWRNTERNRQERKKEYREDEYEKRKKGRVKYEWSNRERTEGGSKVQRRFIVSKYRAIQYRSGCFEKFVEI